MKQRRSLVVRVDVETDLDDFEVVDVLNYFHDAGPGDIDVDVSRVKVHGVVLNTTGPVEPSGTSRAGIVEHRMSLRDRRLVYNALVLLKRAVDTEMHQSINVGGGYNSQQVGGWWESVWLSAVQHLEVEGKTLAEIEAMYTPPVAYPYHLLPNHPRLLSTDLDNVTQFLDQPEE